jgi:hypothetical protein
MEIFTETDCVQQPSPHRPIDRRHQNTGLVRTTHLCRSRVVAHNKSRVRRRRRAVALPVEGKHSRRGWIENDGIRLLAGRHIRDTLHRLQVKNRDPLRIGRCSRTRDRVRARSHAPRSIGDVAYHSSGVYIQHFDLSAMRNVQAASGLVNRKLIPTSLAGDGDLLRDLIIRGRSHSDQEREQNNA